MQKLSQRIKELRTKLGLKQSELAKIMGAGEATIKAMEQERTFGIKPKYAVALEEKLKVNRDWIEKGIGDMFITEHGKLLSQIAILDKALNSKAISFPYFEDLTDTDSYVNLCMPDGIISDQNKSLSCVRINDDAMKSTIERGSLVFVDTSDCTVSSGKIYKISLNDEIMVRRIYKTATKETFLIKADNHIFPERLVELSDFIILGRVCVTMCVTQL